MACKKESYRRELVTEDFITFAKDHTISEIGKQFNLKYWMVRQLVTIYKIPYKKITVKCLGYLDKENNVKHSCKRTGEAQEMIKVLNKTFTQAAIARVFGYSRERIRQICLED